MKTAFFVAAIAAVIISCEAGTPYKDCGSDKGKVKDVIVGGCTSAPCILKKGANASITIDFTPTIAVPTLTAVVHGYIAGVPVPFPIPDPNCCLNHGLKCPLKPNVPVSYHTSLFVRTQYPSLKLVVKWEMKTVKAETVVCIEFPAELHS